MANDFTGDPTCRALWRFEIADFSGDSIDGNDLTNVNTVTPNTIIYKEGFASAQFIAANEELFEIDDGDLDIGYPLRSNDPIQHQTMATWLYRTERIGQNCAIYQKGDTLAPTRSFLCYIGTNNRIIVLLYNGGPQFYTTPATYSLDINTWYHISVTFNNVEQFLRVRIWDDTAKQLILDHVFVTVTTQLSTVGVTIGARQTTPGSHDYFLGGILDELVMFARVLTTSELDWIRMGIYGTPFNTLLVDNFEIDVEIDPTQIADGKALIADEIDFSPILIPTLDIFQIHVIDIVDFSLSNIEINTADMYQTHFMTAGDIETIFEANETEINWTIFDAHPDRTFNVPPVLYP